jgi:hypothetical protein
MGMRVGTRDKPFGDAHKTYQRISRHPGKTFGKTFLVRSAAGGRGREGLGSLLRIHHPHRLLTLLLLLP